MYAYSQIQEYLCEMGIKYYEQGDYDQALEEFNKALVIGPNYEPALRYIEMIKQMGGQTSDVISAQNLPFVNDDVLELRLIQREMINDKKEIIPRRLKAKNEILQAQEINQIFAKEKKTLPLRAIALDENFRRIIQPIEIEQEKKIVFYGKNIQRFLVTQPNIIKVEQKGANELLITGQGIGYTYVYIWDDFGRWTAECLGIFPAPEGPTLEEQLRIEEERTGTFKLRYGLDWNSFEQGRGLRALQRQSYTWSHNLGLTGSTPYGNLDSNLIVRSLSQTTDLTYYTVGLTNGVWGNLKDFSLRGFDYSPSFSNLVFPGSSNLRGIMLSSPAFNHLVDYTVFWGREGGGRYGNLSPGLTLPKDSFMDGLDLNFRLPQESKVGFTVVHGSGGDRPEGVERFMYDADAAWHVGGFNMSYDLGFNGDTFANLFSGNFIKPNFKFNYELRDIPKKFVAINGQSWRQGERGGLFSLDFIPRENLYINNRLDIYQDRLFPSLENSNRWNEDYDLNVRFDADPSLSYSLDYTLQNELGRLSQRRYQSPGIGVSKTFSLIRKVNTFLNYRYAESQNPGSPSLDYTNEKVYAGLRFSLIGDLYYFLNNEWNWLTETSSGNITHPTAMETGVDFNSQVFKTPFYQTLRFTYRNEEDTASPLSFLSGEDYIEGYAEVSYRPVPDKEVYCSTRVRNIWADNPNVNKRIEADFNVGMRLAWDSGIRWESAGNIDGYVFKDLNSDGLRENDEAPVQGVKVWLGKNKFQVTDLFGYYKFKDVRAAKAHISIDVSTLPPGFVLTVPISQEAVITQGSNSRIYFGIIAPSEISGFIFEDTRGNGEFNKGDIGVKGVVVTLDDNRKSVTDASGRYLFTNTVTGKHVISLDLNSIPLYYLPQVAITKEATLFEGVAYIYNIPVKRVKQE